MGEVRDRFPACYQELAALCAELDRLDPRALEQVILHLEAVVAFCKRRKTEEFPPESLMVLKQP